MTPTYLDWSDDAHWTRGKRDCRLCGKPTNLRDGAGRPVHKVCLEEVVDQVRRDDETSRQKDHP